MCKRGCRISSLLQFISPLSAPAPPPILSQPLQCEEHVQFNMNAKTLKCEIYVYRPCPKHMSETLIVQLAEEFITKGENALQL